jgi:hypothetical protein
MKIKPRFVLGRYNRRTGTRGPERDLFEKYQVGTIRKTEHGYTFVEIIGPRKTFSLMSCALPLTIISPPEVDGGDAIQRKVPLYFVSPMNGTGQIQGATYFAEIDGELVAYRGGGGSVYPL